MRDKKTEILLVLRDISTNMSGVKSSVIDGIRYHPGDSSKPSMVITYYLVGSQFELYMRDNGFLYFNHNGSEVCLGACIAEVAEKLTAMVTKDEISHNDKLEIKKTIMNHFVKNYLGFRCDGCSESQHELLEFDRL